MGNYKHTFCGSSSNNDNKFEDVFDEVFDSGDSMVFVSKETKRVYLGSKNIDLKLVLEITDMNEYCDEHAVLATLYYVPVFKHLDKKRKVNLLVSLGDPDITVDEYAKSKWYYSDAVSDGLGIYLCQEKREYESDEKYEEVLEKLKADIANTCCGYMGLIGFYLDRPVNRIGENGWDYLRQYCNGVKMQTILKELKKRYS